MELASRGRQLFDDPVEFIDRSWTRAMGVELSLAPREDVQSVI